MVGLPASEVLGYRRANKTRSATSRHSGGLTPEPRGPLVMRLGSLALCRWCLPARSLFHTASLAALTGRARMIFRAGLALNTVGSLVNGLMPLRSLVAGFFITTNFAKPGTRNVPFFFNSL